MEKLGRCGKNVDVKLEMGFCTFHIQMKLNHQLNSICS
ncbi:hypothetical protein X975_06884, partial [Stegodyphus mimosarum]